jgi:hypothetical protein
MNEGRSKEHNVERNEIETKTLLNPVDQALDATTQHKMIYCACEKDTTNLARS